MDREQRKLRRLPSHGTLIAFVALFVALGGAGYAATNIGGGVKVTCKAKHGRNHVSCAVVRGPAVGPRGPRGPQGPPGTKGASGGSGPTTFTQEPAYTVDPSNNPNWLTAIGAPVPNRYLEEQYDIAQDSNPTNDVQNDIYMPLQSPSQIGGGSTHLSSVQFCINISANSNALYSGQSAVSVDKATVYELSEPNPNGGPGSGNSNGPPPYSQRTPLLQQSYTGQTQIDSCLTASTTSPQAIDPNGYLVLAVTLGLTTSGKTNAGYYGTNYVQLGRVTTTYTP